MTDITLYHNPRCSKSRQTLALLEENGHTPNVVLYLDQPPTADTLGDIVKMLGVNTHDIIRKGEDAYSVDMATWSDSELFTAITNSPGLMQRPIVVANGQARIGRPPESVLAIL